MALTPEVKVKRVVVAQLKELKAYYFYPVTGGYGASGVPDIVGSFGGKFFGIECKAGNNRPTPLQLKNLLQIQASGGIAAVVNEENMHNIQQILKGEVLWTPPKSPS